VKFYVRALVGALIKLLYEMHGATIKNVKIKHPELYFCLLFCTGVKLREEHSLRDLENRELRKIFKHKRE